MSRKASRLCVFVAFFLAASVLLVGNYNIAQAKKDETEKKKKVVKIEKFEWKNVTNEEITLITNSTFKLKVVIGPKEVKKKKYTLTYETDDPEIATVTEKGTIKAIAPGEACITCTFKAKNQKKKELDCFVTVKPKLVTSVTLTKTSDPIVQIGHVYAGETKTTVLPKDAYNRNVKFTSSNSSVAKVNSSTGIVTGVGVGSATITCQAKDASKKKAKYKITVVGNINPQVTKFVAHRGVSSEAPENTVRAFKLAGEAGFWGIETDVRETKDGQYILLHDETFTRMCGVDKTPAELTLNEIRQLEITGGNNIEKYKSEGDIEATRIATLEEYLVVCKEYNMVPVIEIKTVYTPNTQSKAKADMRKLYNYVGRYIGSGEVKFVGFDLETMVQLQDALKEVSSSSSYGTRFSVSHISTYANTFMINFLKNRTINVSHNYQYFKKATLTKYHEQGISVDLYTIDDQKSAWKWVDAGADSITTNVVFWEM